MDHNQQTLISLKRFLQNKKNLTLCWKEKKEEEEEEEEETTTKLLKNSAKGEKKTSNFRAKLTLSKRVYTQEPSNCKNPSTAATTKISSQDEALKEPILENPSELEEGEGGGGGGGSSWVIDQSGSEYFLLQNLGFFQTPKNLWSFSVTIQAWSLTRDLLHGHREWERERERELRMWSWSFGFSFSSATRAEAGELPLSSGGQGGGGVLIFPSSQVLRMRGSGSRFW